MHGLRLVVSLKHALRNNEIIVNFNQHTPDVARMVRKGQFSFGNLMNMIYEDMRGIRILEEESTMPEVADEDAIDDLLFDFRIKNIKGEL